MEGEKSFLGEVRKKAGKLGKAALFTAGLAAASGAEAQELKEIAEASALEQYADRFQAARELERKQNPEKTKLVDENLEIFLVETVEPFIKEMKSSVSKYDSIGLASDQYTLGREPGPEKEIGLDEEIHRLEGEMSFGLNASNTALKFMKVLIEQISREEDSRLDHALQGLKEIQEKFSDKLWKQTDERSALIEKKKELLKEQIRKVEML